MRCTRGLPLFAVVASVLFATLGAGIAHAKNDPLIGKSYADASASISKWGGNWTPTVSTAVGSRLALDECIVTSWRRTSYVEEDNFDHKKAVLISLNCNEKLAAPGAPGNSLVSPQGQAQKAAQVRADRYNTKPQRCANNLDSCRSFCEKNSALCSEEVMALLG